MCLGVLRIGAERVIENVGLVAEKIMARERSFRHRTPPHGVSPRRSFRLWPGLPCIPLPAVSGAFLLLLVLLWSAPAEALSGGLTGRITNTDGDALAKVEIILEGKTGSHTVRSDEEGRFRLGDLVPGNYSLIAAQDGYSQASYKPVNIRLGRTTHVAVRMSAAVEETIVITSEPALAANAEGETKTILRPEELEQIAHSDDPWSSVAEASGLITQVQTAGHRGSTVVAAGADARQNSMAVDDDVLAGDHASRVYTPDQISRVEVTHGGLDARISGAGAHFNLVTRRGHNPWRGAVRFGFADRDWQAEHPDALPAGDDLSEFSVNRILAYQDYGGDAGGRLIRDRVWAWGSIGGQRIERRAVGGLADDIELEHYAGKLQSQLGSNSAVLSYHYAQRDQLGLGAGPDRSAETLLRDLEPNRMLRFEDSQMISPRIHLLGSWVHLQRDAWSAPLNSESEEIVLGEDGIWYGTFGDFRNAREAENLRAEASWARPVKSAHQEIRFGWTQGDIETSTSERWGNSSLIHLAGENFGTPFDLVRLTRPSTLAVSQNENAFWVQDSIRFRSLTLDIGLRYEVQRGRNLAGQAEANPLFPDLLPAVDFAGDGSRFTWNSVSPRLAVAWSLGRQDRTVLRASYASYASRLYPDLVSRVNPLAASEVTVAYQDLDSDQRLGESDSFYVIDHQGFQLNSPRGSVLNSPHQVDPVLNAERTDELRFGAERRFGTALEVGLDYQNRQLSNVLELRRYVRDQLGRVRLARRGDYQLDSIYSGLLPDGQPFAAPVYSLRPGVEFTGGNFLANGDREQRFESWTLRFERPLANRWMVRARWTWNDWRWSVGESFSSFDDPTDAADLSSPDGGVSLADGDGDIVAAQTLDGDGNLFLNSRWLFNILGLYQVAPNRPWGFQVSAQIHGREGYPIPYTVAALRSDRSLQNVQVTPSSGQFRLEDVYTVDLRLEKAFRILGARTTLSLEGFNLLNKGYVLERENQLNSPQANAVQQTTSPRTLQIGLRIGLE